MEVILILDIIVEVSFSGSSDHIINFTANSTVSNVIMNLVFFVPALLTLEGGDLLEVYG
jgi:hypothetical protein